MTKTVKKLLICLMALVMTVCCGFAVIGLNKTVVNAESTYDIKILGTSLSDSNLTFDNSDNASVTGSLTYSPEESKLTLNNFVFNGATGDHVINIVSSTSKNLTVELIGDSEITITESTSSSKSPAAFYIKDEVRGEICFVGGGSFTVDNVNVKSSTAAFYTYYKNIFVYNCQLTGKGYRTGIQYYDSIAAYGENASILATATNPYSERDPFNSSNRYIYPALALMGGYMYKNRSTQKVEVSFEIDGSNPSSTVSTDKGTYASYKYFHITPATVTVSAYRPNEIGTYYNFSPSTLTYGEKITVTPAPGYVLTGIDYIYNSLQPAYSLQPDGSYVLDTADANYTQYDTIKFWANYAEAKTITKTPSVGGDYVVPSAGAYNKVVTITPKPNAGYYTDTVTVTQANGDTVTVTGPNADGTYTFVMPGEEVSISVDFKQLTTYDVWVAGIRLDSRNLTIDSEDNNAITGSATYDAENNTLTLDNFVYNGAGYLFDIVYDSDYDEYYYNYAGIYSKGDLNIVLNGENTLNCAITDEDSDNIYKTCEGINVDGALTIGGGTLNATIEGNAIVANTLTIDSATLNSNSTSVNIYLYGDAIISNSKVFAKGGSPVIAIGYGYELKITNSTVVIQSEDSYYGISYGSAINIDENSVLEVTTKNTAIQNIITVNFSQNHNVYAGTDSASAQLVAVPDNTTFASKYVKIAPAYDVWVAGVQFDASNLTIDSNDNSAITGSATYDAENNILTLDNFSYTGAGYNYSGSNANALIYSTGIDLKIVLKGTNKLVGLVDVYEGIAINNGSLTIAGSDEYSDTASLELTVETTCIYADCSLSIENVKLTTTTTALPTGNGSPTEAIFTYDGDLSIMSSEVTVIAGDSDGDGIIEFGYTMGIISVGNVTITDSSVNVAANAGGLGAESRMTIDNSTVIIEGGTGGTQATATYITNSTVKISGEIAIETNTMYGGYFSVSNSNVEISAQEYAIHDLYYNKPLDDGRLYDITGHVIYGGEDKESATILTEQVDIFGHKYLRFAPASKVTVNYGIDGVDNEEFTIEKGTTISLETPEIDGYVFIGWYNEDTLETAFDFSTPITEDIIIYAKFANYTQDIANINSQINGVKDSITSLQSSIDGKADATELVSNVTDLQGKIDDLTNNYQSADAKQQEEINTLKQQVSTLINDTIVLLNSKVTDIESEIADINNAISTNESDITANAGKIETLTTNLSAVQNVVDKLGETYIDNTELSSLKAELVDTDNQIKGLIETLTAKVTDIESEIANINSSISSNAGDITANADNITSLTNQLTALQGVVDSLGDTYIDNTEFSSLKAELVDADNQIKGLITALTAKVEKTESDIASLVSNKADVTLVTEKVEELKGLINSLEAVKNNYLTADEELKNQLTTVINNAKQQAIDSATELVNSAKAELTIAINAKADTATVNVKVEELNKTIENAKTVANAYTDGKVEELNSAIATAKQQAIDSATELVNSVKAELTIAINAKADTATVNAKVKELNKAIENAKTVANAYTDGKVEELNSAIATAKQQAIDSATELVNSAKEELTIAINAKADTATVNAKVEELNKAIENAKTVANAYTDGKVEELNSAIATAKQQAIDSATELVNSAKAELNAAIALKADNATVIAKFAEVDSAIAILQGLSDDYLSADTELKEELTTLIANTKAEIIELIIAGDKANADALEEEIAKLRAEIEALKNATNEDIKEAESNAQVLPTVIASVAVLGDIALLVWLIIKRKIVK